VLKKAPITPPWWKTTTVYQIYPRSYIDSTGTGVGDLPGIISKLDYLQDLGVETIWFSPFFSSPQADHGYDVSNYRAIAPEYGTMVDCERLIHEIHNRGMYVVFDMVLNHTSDQHPWFLESRSSRNNPKRDWYIWCDGQKTGGKKPPNNWKSMVGGSGWQYDELTDQWYWTQFLPFQPDLNYRNPEVKGEMLDTVRFWLDKGVDGFRLDIINALFEDEHLQNNPFVWRLFPSEDFEKSFFQNRIYTINYPDNFDFVKELRGVVDEYSEPERVLVGEIAASLDVLKKYCGEKIDRARTNGLHLTFLFQSLNTKFNASAFHRLIDRYEQYFSEPYMPTWVFSNHDQMRQISKLRNSVDKAKIIAALQLTARGVPFIYYAEEIGMLNHRLPLKTALDPVARKYSWIPQPLVNILTRGGHISLNRDDCRTPMQWDSSPNAGFCSKDVEPWLPIAQGHETINVESELSDPNSLMHFFRELLWLRRKMPALHSGSMNLITPAKHRKSILAYERKHNEQVIQVWLNFSDRQIRIDDISEGAQLLLSTLKGLTLSEASCIHLEPYQGIVLDRLV
jgi:alpha-glucosidase